MSWGWGVDKGEYIFTKIKYLISILFHYYVGMELKYN